MAKTYTELEFWLIKKAYDAKFFSSVTDAECVLVSDAFGAEVDDMMRDQFEHLKMLHNGYHEIVAFSNGMLVHPNADEMSIEQMEAYILQEARAKIPKAFRYANAE